MDLKQIDVFRAVAQYGGFSRAARTLGVSQPSLTRSVARLEANLGFALFVRGQGAARLTPEGAAFQKEVARNFAGLERLRSAAQDIRNFGTGRLRIACLVALSSGVMPRALRRFLDNFPEATVSLQVRPSTTVYEWVASQQCQLGFASPRAGFPAVREEQLFDLPGVLAMPRGHRLGALRRVLAPADITGEPFLALGPEDGMRLQADATFRAANVTPRVPVETPQSATLAAMVLAGLGITLLNPLVADDMIRSPLIFRPFRPRVMFTSHVLRTQDDAVDRLADAFLAIVKSEATSTVERLRGRGWCSG